MNLYSGVMPRLGVLALLSMAAMAAEGQWIETELANGWIRLERADGSVSVGGSTVRAGGVTGLVAPVAAGRFVVEVVDGAAIGFNDPRPVAPVAGNGGRTVGEQRLNVVAAAAREWSHRFVSPVGIRVEASWLRLPCGSETSTLVAGAPQLWFQGASLPRANTWYPWPLANAIRGAESDPKAAQAHILLIFNDSIGEPGCLQGRSWDYRVGVAPGSNQVSLFTATFHELAHTMGFATLVGRGSGVRAMGRDDIFMTHLEDHDLGKVWPAMTNFQRKLSMEDTGRLHWVGQHVLLEVTILSKGRDPAGGHPLLYAPSELDPFLSVIHFDSTLDANQHELMEPFPSRVMDTVLTGQALMDLGWPMTKLRVRRVSDIDGSKGDEMAVLVAETSPA